MSVRPPRISIGLPVYNGGQHLLFCLESILGQSFEDFELIISDNASTDQTEEICRRFLKSDARIRYIRNPYNLGAAANFNRVTTLARAPYFKWAAHDDLLAPDFLARCAEVLDRFSDVLLCCTRVRVIDSHGAVASRRIDDLPGINSPRPETRFAELVLKDHQCTPIFGLIRREPLARTKGIAPYIASDRVLLAELSLRGRLWQIPDELFFSREHGGRSIRTLPFHQRAHWYDPRLAGRRTLPHWRFFTEYVRCIHRLPLQGCTRMACMVHLLRWPTVNLNGLRLLSDLVIAGFPKTEAFFHAAKKQWITIDETR
ncbi:MAG: glycosyltransferase family 2 protein [Desulfobacterales bacterium]|nr:glycosyltransferase family 2 protein [Desulfobacterales bacterium]